MSGRDKKRRRGVVVTGSWLPVALEFLRSRACAELSPHGAKLLLDCLATLGPNASRNGDLSLAPKVMAVRGWTSKSTLAAAIEELEAHGLLIRTRQGSRLDCSLFALTLYPLDCDLGKIDVRPGGYRTTDYMDGGRLALPPSEMQPARWRHARKTKTLPPRRNDTPRNRPATGHSSAGEAADCPSSSRHGTKTPIFPDSVVPPRGTYIDKPSLRPAEVWMEGGCA